MSSGHRFRDVLATTSANAVGGACIAVGFAMTRQQTSPGGQNGWIDLCVGGVILSGAANGLWLRRERSRVRRAREALLGSLASRRLEAVTPRSHAHRFAATATGSRFHDLTCVLVQGKATLVARRERHLSQGRAPCEVCQP